jgi:predicted bacteriocin transport accessory protein
MKNKTVLAALLVGLLFGFLFSGTLGIDFFGSNDDMNDNEVRDDLKKDEEGFRLAYNLTDSIYVPIYGDDVYDKMEDSESFVVYVGRDTCPYCQQFVPNLMEAAENLDMEMIYHVDSVDDENEMFITDGGYNYTPTTLIVKDGVIVEVVIGYKTTSEIQQLLEDSLS